MARMLLGEAQEHPTLPEVLLDPAACPPLLEARPRPSVWPREEGDAAPSLRAQAQGTCTEVLRASITQEHNPGALSPLALVLQPKRRYIVTFLVKSV